MVSFNDIIVYEKVFDEEDAKKIYELRNESRWAIQYSDTTKKDVSSPFWTLPLAENEFITNHCFQQVKKLIGDNFTINNVYLNGQSAHQDGYPHYDDTDINTYTFLVYLNPNWDILWGGHTTFVSMYWDPQFKKAMNFNPMSNEINAYSFTPKPNCALFFPSILYHYGAGPSSKMKDIRFTLAYKLKKIV